MIRIPCAEGQTVTCNGKVIYRNGSFTAAGALKPAGTGDGYVAVSVFSAENQALRFEARS